MSPGRKARAGEEELEPAEARGEDGYAGAPPPSGTQQADLHRLMVQGLRDHAIVALDTTGRILTWNAGAERFEGYRADEIIGSDFSVFYPLEDVAAGTPAHQLREAARYGSVEHEGFRVRKDGSRFWADVVTSAIRDENGALVGFAQVTRDLTARRDADEQLRLSEERFRLLVQSVKDYAIFMLDPEGRVSTWNEGAERIKGYTADEIIGRHFSVFYPAEAVATRFPQHELEMAARTGRFEDEGWRVRKDGSLFWANVIITALRDETGKLVGFAKVTRDLTERRQLQERAIADARRVAEMEAAARAKSEFLTTVSHELRTPLNAIGGYADLLALELPGPLNETQKQYLGRIKTGQQHLLALVNDLLNYTRLETGHLEYDLGPVPVLRVLHDLQAMIQPQAMAKGIAFSVASCPGDAVAWADAARVQQILLNLLTNAIKFTPANGHVSVACSFTDGEVGISVLDTGPGIPEEKQDAVFEPFVQLGRSLTSSHEGVGLGLAISRDLARAMSGDLKLSSHLGEGSTFTLILPRAGAQPQ